MKNYRTIKTKTNKRDDVLGFRYPYTTKDLLP